ncbi:alpha/beta fold hydrolase [Curtobacterium sp. UCD-KPL2560]|uniref:alpha/beta fold hydrolase n=1 Tax=Curtobacterium sp. UCD-KPL2560 TaxID=1885315 RepID=UPI00082578BD|nr:alpha/beta fold hydrolase [Curtobacterium sp. UCD-KPL2560]
MHDEDHPDAARPAATAPDAPAASAAPAPQAPPAPDPAGELSDAEDADVTVRVDRIAVDGTYVRVSSIGAPGDRAFVLVAGLGIASTYYERLAPHLNEHGPVHALDLPGFAGVPRFRGGVSIERYADAVEQVLRELRLEDPVLVGHSMGTQVVTEVAARNPGLSDLVLISPVVDRSARTIRQSAFRFLRSALHEPAAVRWHAVTAYALCGWHWFRRVLPRMIAFPIEERAADVRARTLIVRGEHDAMVPRDWVRSLARVFPHAVLREVVDGAHSVMHAQADAVARLAVAHVDGRITDRGVGSLQRVRDHTTSSDLARLGPADAWLVLKSRFRELFGMARGDDEALEEAKSAHAVAMADGDGIPVDPSDRREVVDEVAPEVRDRS